MAWNPQGGGQGPWGGGGGGGGPSGPQPPDIEEMLRRGQERFKSFMPGGMKPTRGIFLIVVALVGIWLASGFYRVDAAQQGVVMLFGRHVQSTGPGLHWYFPTPIGTVLTPDVEKVRRTDIGYRGADSTVSRGVSRKLPEESLMLTSDQNIIDLNFSVQWKVKNASDYLFKIRGPEETVKRAAESAMREVIGQTSLQLALTTGRSEIETGTRVLLQRILDNYQSGVLVTEVKLQAADPPQAVIDAFNEVQRARQDQDRKLNEAEAYRNKVVPTARGEAAKMIQDATAYKERLTKEAEGEAQRFLSVYKSFKETEDVARQRLYLETMEGLLSGASKVIIDSKGGSGVVPYLPLPELKKRSGGGQ